MIHCSSVAHPMKRDPVRWNSSQGAIINVVSMLSTSAPSVVPKQFGSSIIIVVSWSFVLLPYLTKMPTFAFQPNSSLFVIPSKKRPSPNAWVWGADQAITSSFCLENQREDISRHCKDGEDAGDDIGTLFGFNDVRMVLDDDEANRHENA